MEWFDKLEVLKGVLGSEELCSEICRAIGSYEAEKVLSYIMRMWDVDDELDDDELDDDELDD